MKIKYYLCGLGIGIVITTLIFTLAVKNENKMTDEEVIQRAKELGMVEAYETGVLADSENEQDADESDVEPADKSDIARQDENADSSIDAEDSEDKASVSESSIDKESDAIQIAGMDEADKSSVSANETAKEEEKEVEVEKVSVVVEPGEGSYRIAEKVAAAGLVSSAREFNRYLCENGYEMQMRSGTFKIPKGADEETIAKILTKTL